MTDFRDRPDAADRWRATIEALEALVQAAPEQAGIDPSEADEVRRLIMMRLAAARPNNLPAAWVRRPEIVPQIVPDAEPPPKAAEPDEPTPRSPDPAARPRPAWHE